MVDFTYVPTWSGMVFSAFVTDVFSRRIVGWRTKATMPTELPLDAFEMALWTREQAAQLVDGLVHHSDAGTQYTSIRYAHRLADAGAVASIATARQVYSRGIRVRSGRQRSHSGKSCEPGTTDFGKVGAFHNSRACPALEYPCRVSSLMS
ncbi:MAG: DDE-type integrase/transposase/recombinase [Actinobacteria bacterium]|nr:DDE-type integrase/transposase/recombinase [Actinomycetota bacterium]